MKATISCGMRVAIGAIYTHIYVCVCMYSLNYIYIYTCIWNYSGIASGVYFQQAKKSLHVELPFAAVVVPCAITHVLQRPCESKMLASRI